MSKFLTIVFLFLAVIAGSIEQASANIFVRDNRKSVAPQVREPLSRIGRLIKANGSWGTAFLIGHCHILSNYHVTFADQSSPNLDETLTFELGQGVRVSAKPVRFGLLNPKGSALNDDDWTLLKLDSCLGDQYGWFELETRPLLAVTGEQIVFAGYPWDKSTEQLTVDFDCRIHNDKKKDLSKDVWRHDCASRAGNSGGPLLVEKDGDYVVVALNMSQMGNFIEIIRYYDPYFANGSIPMSAILPQIEDLKNSKDF